MLKENNMMDKKDLINEITPMLKEKNFKKRGNTWTLELTDTIIVFNIQNSNFDSTSYYINVGTVLKIIETPKNPVISNCHIWQRMDIEFTNAEQIVKMIDIWVTWYGSNSSVHNSIISNHMPKTTQNIVYKYLSVYEY
jgi:hypothetical protein